MQAFNERCYAVYVNECLHLQMKSNNRLKDQDHDFNPFQK